MRSSPHRRRRGDNGQPRRLLWGPTRRQGPRAGTSGTASEDRIRASYATLQVAYGAPWREVKRAHRAMARTVHPDIAEVPDADAWQRVNDAYAVLAEHYGQPRVLR